MPKELKLDNSKLRELLKKINTDSKTRDIYNSKLHGIMNYLRKTTGFKIAAVKEGGSRGKKTDTRTSDLDIPFCTSENQDKNIVRKDLLERATKSFKQGAKVHLSSRAVQIDFFNPKCHVDVVYLTNQEFQRENKEITQIKKLRPLYKDAIKLGKYALDKAKQANIAGYEVELACLTLQCNDLAECVYHLINYFLGRIKKNGATIDKVIRFLK